MRKYVLVVLALVAGIAVFFVTRSSERDARVSRAQVGNGEGQDRSQHSSGASEGTSAETRPAPTGLVIGRLSYPRLAVAGKSNGGRPAAVVTRNGLAMARKTLAQGPFEIHYSRAPHDSYALEISLSGCRPVRLDLPRPRLDTGHVVLFPTMTYGGWIRQAAGEGVKGVTVQLWQVGREIALLGRSNLTEEGGRFVVSLNEAVQFLLMPQGETWRGVEVHVVAPGRSVARVAARAEGLRGEHIVTVGEEGDRLRLRCLTAQTRRPLSNAAFALRAARAFRTPVRTLDAGETDESGEFEPRWPENVGPAIVEVEGKTGGRVLFLLNRESILQEPRADLLVPDAPRRHAIRVQYARSQEPVMGGRVEAMATVRVQGNGNTGSKTEAAVTLSGVTDAEGNVAWAFETGPYYDSKSFRFIFWRVVYPDEHGNWREENGNRLILRTEEDDGVRALVEVGGPEARRDESLWVSLREGGAALEIRPDTLGVALLAGEETRNYFWGKPEGPGVRDKRGRLLWRFPTLTADPVIGPGFRAVFTAMVPGRRAQQAAVTLDDWRKASESTHPLVLDLAVDDRDLAGARIRVVGVDGGSAPNVVVVLGPLGAESRKRFWTESVRVTTDAAGFAHLWSAADGVTYRVVAQDPITGATGVLEKYGIANAQEEPVVVHLEAPRAFEATVSFRDGTSPKVLAARLESDPPNLLPRIRCSYDGKGKISSPEVSLAAYRLYVSARRPGDGRMMKKDLPAARAYRTSVVLSEEARVVPIGPPPPRPR